MGAAPRYPNIEIHTTRERVLSLPSEVSFACFQRDAVGVIARTELAASPGIKPRTVEVRYVVPCPEYDAQSERERRETAEGFVALGIHHRLATVA